MPVKDIIGLSDEADDVDRSPDPDMLAMFYNIWNGE